MSFLSKRSGFERNNAALKDMIQGHMAADIETGIKLTAGTPVKTGTMKSQVRHFKNAEGQFRVEASAAYSAYQERGARKDGTHRVRHYTTAGTSAGWFRRAIDTVLRHRETYIMEARKALGL